VTLLKVNLVTVFGNYLYDIIFGFKKQPREVVF